MFSTRGRPKIDKLLGLSIGMQPRVKALIHTCSIAPSAGFDFDNACPGLVKHQRTERSRPHGRQINDHQILEGTDCRSPGELTPNHRFPRGCL